MKKDKSIKSVQRKTNTPHNTGWHKKSRNPTTNFPPDTHKIFCERCKKFNHGCPNPFYESMCSL